MDIHIKHPCRCPAHEIDTRMQQLAEKLQQEYPVTLLANSKGWQIQGQGLSGSIERLDNEIQVQLKLGLLMRALRGQIEQGIRQALEKHL